MRHNEPQNYLVFFFSCQMFSTGFDLWYLLALGITLLFSLAFHEAAHAFVAHALGDNTAQREGRLTLNPVRHLDFFGTLAFLIIGFGWGKPVPVNSHNLERPRQDLALIAIAGPLTNLLLAFVAVGVSIMMSRFALLSEGSFWALLLQLMIFINTLLALFNLIPIAPLDGGNLLLGIVPKRSAGSVEEFLQTHGFVLLMVLLGIDLFFHVPIITGPLFFLAEKIITLFVFLLTPLLAG